MKLSETYVSSEACDETAIDREKHFHVRRCMPWLVYTGRTSPWACFGFIHFQFTPFSSDPCRQVFNTTFLEMVVLLDIQVPTLLMADFNGTVSPERDFSTPDDVRFVVCYHACCHPVVPFWTCSWWCPLRTSLSSFARPKRECCIFLLPARPLFWATVRC